MRAFCRSQGISMGGAFRPLHLSNGTAINGLAAIPLLRRYLSVAAQKPMVPVAGPWSRWVRKCSDVVSGIFWSVYMYYVAVDRVIVARIQSAA
ncbi:unnamed protein product [Clonostachys rosea]|uniref:Uncharacterized protein n=1 Tax=Bionectria ochroleuca TaxID=29856 RepID=A0ABY6V091_BIOOC|nr:unnamed protein product [Clonostachys rosea]